MRGGALSPASPPHRPRSRPTRAPRETSRIDEIGDVPRLNLVAGYMRTIRGGELTERKTA